MLTFIRQMDIDSHDRCILRGENHHRPSNDLHFQTPMVGSWVDVGWRGSLGERTVASEGKEGCSEC